MSNLQFIPSATAVNFRAYCDAMNAALKMGIMELDQLSKEGGLNDLYALQNQVMADAILKSGEEQAASKRADAIGQIVGGAVSGAVVAGTSAYAYKLEKQTKSNTTISAESTTTAPASGAPKAPEPGAAFGTKPTKPADPTVKPEGSAAGPKETPQETRENKALKTGESEAQTFANKAYQARQIGNTLASSLQGFATGTAGIWSASHQLAAAHADELKTLADGGVNQANRAIQLLTTLLQLIKEQKDLAMQTQTAIAQATHA